MTVGRLSVWERDRAGAGADPPEERLRGDGELVERLRSLGFTGPEYELVMEELAAYGLDWAKAWIGSGRMHRQSAKRGRPLGSPWFLTNEDVQDLASEAAAAAVVLFRRDALIGGRWSATGGANLTTYFVGTIVLVFPAIYRTWRRQQYPWPRADPEELLNLAAPESDVDRLAEGSALQRTLLDFREHDRRAYAVLMRRFEGYRYAEIAHEFGLSSAAVSGIIQRGKKWLREKLKDVG